MHLLSRLIHVSLGSVVLLMVGCTPIVAPELEPNARDAAPWRVTDVELLGVITAPVDKVAFDTPVGGLSAIAYNSEADLYYVLSDDRAANGPVRIYQVSIDLSHLPLEESALAWTGLIQLYDETGSPFAPGAIDPEGLVYMGDRIYVASEGNTAAQPPLAPGIFEFTSEGTYVASLPLPAAYLPQAEGARGVRNNLAFESLTRTPDGRYLVSGVENALLQDGPAASLEQQSLARLLKIDLHDEHAAVEQVYVVDAIPVAPEPASGFADNGLTELIAIDNYDRLLALERSYAEGKGNTVRLYMVDTRDAMDVSGLDKLSRDDEPGMPIEIDRPVVKELLVDFGTLGSELGVAPDNLEGMTLGPGLPDGRQVLVVVSDNNFNASQTTQFWILALSEDPHNVLSALEPMVDFVSSSESRQKSLYSSYQR